MTSSPAIGSNATHTKTGLAKEQIVKEKPLAQSPRRARKASTSSQSPSTVSVNDVNATNCRAFAQNGHANDINGHDESEAETVVLSPDTAHRKKAKKIPIKAEEDDGDVSSRLSSSPKHRRRSSGTTDNSHGTSKHGQPARNGHKRSTNGVHHEDRQHNKSPTLSNRSLSNPSVDSSARSRKSPSADDATSPTVASSERGRASSTGATRKRKIREEHHLRNLEPPRQRLKSDPAGKTVTTQSHRDAPASPPAVDALRSHKRSASSQSLATGLNGRRRREISAVRERKQWRSDTSSEASSSPQPTTPAVPYLPTIRTKRSSHRSMGSPARQAGQMGHPKKNVDKFGATRLAREGEKGNLDAVEAAYEAAPEELDQADFAGFAPLQKASLNGHAEVVEFLLEKGCRTDCHSKEHDTPLIDAVENGHLEVVRLLLEAGVNPHFQNKKGERAIDVLPHDDDDVDEIESLLRKAMLEHASDDDGMSTDAPLTTRDLVNGEHRNDLLYVESTLPNLRKYAAKGDAVAVDHFLSSVAPDTGCVTGAARGGHETVLNLLLASPSEKMEKDPDPAKSDRETPLVAAIGRGHLNILRILLDQDNFNPARRTSGGKTYFELAEERKGPKWQQEVELLKERYDQYRARKQALKKRSMGAHTAEKASKVAKLRGQKSPEMKKGKRPLSPTVGDDRQQVRVGPPKIKHEKSTDGIVRKIRAVDTVKNPKDKARRRRVVDEDTSEDEHEDDVVPKAQTRRVSEVSPKTRKEALSAVATVGTSKKRRSSTSTTSQSNKENHTLVKQPEQDEEMLDAPLPIPAVVKAPTKQHTPEPVRLSRIQDAEKEANRQRLVAERERLAEEQRAAAIIEARKREERQQRLEKLPLALRLACEKGSNRPLHFSATEVGISMCFLPLHVTPQSHLVDEPASPLASQEEQWMLSFQAVGILGLPEPDVLLSFPDWETRSVTIEQRQKFLKSYDISVLAYEKHLPCEDEDDYDAEANEQAAADAKAKFLAMESLAWIKVADFEAAVAQQEWLRGLNLTLSTLLYLRPRESMKPRTFDEMIRGIVEQHRKALMTPDDSPRVDMSASMTGDDAMEVDAVAPASSGIV